jgi:hypothetical protein
LFPIEFNDIERLQTMSLSEHEKIQFELLTANLALDDSDLEKMAKRERATAMSYAALPNANTLLMTLAFINVYFFVSGVLTHNVTLTNVTGMLGMLLTMAIVLNSAKGNSRAYGKQRAGE